MEPDGQLYACDHLINAEHRLGRLDEQTLAAAVDASVQLPFGQKSLRRECQTCSVKWSAVAAARRISTPQATTASAEATTASLATSSHHYALSRDLMA